MRVSSFAALGLTWGLYGPLALGLNLDPDTSRYSSASWWWAPVGSLAGLIAGYAGVVTLSSLSCAAVGGLVGRYAQGAVRSSLGLAAMFAWGAWPGVDAAGAALVVGAVVLSSAWLGVGSFLVHPVAGIAWLGSFVGSRRWLGALAAGAVAIGYVATFDTASTGDRYLFPAALLFAVRR